MEKNTIDYNDKIEKPKRSFFKEDTITKDFIPEQINTERITLNTDYFKDEDGISYNNQIIGNNNINQDLNGNNHKNLELNINKMNYLYNASNTKGKCHDLDSTNSEYFVCCHEQYSQTNENNANTDNINEKDSLFSFPNANNSDESSCFMNIPVEKVKINKKTKLKLQQQMILTNKHNLISGISMIIAMTIQSFLILVYFDIISAFVSKSKNKKKYFITSFETTIPFYFYMFEKFLVISILSFIVCLIKYYKNNSYFENSYSFFIKNKLLILSKTVVFSLLQITLYVTVMKLELSALISTFCVVPLITIIFYYAIFSTSYPSISCLLAMFISGISAVFIIFPSLNFQDKLNSSNKSTQSIYNYNNAIASQVFKSSQNDNGIFYDDLVEKANYLPKNYLFITVLVLFAIIYTNNSILQKQMSKFSVSLYVFMSCLLTMLICLFIGIGLFESFTFNLKDQGWIILIAFLEFLYFYLVCYSINTGEIEYSQLFMYSMFPVLCLITSIFASKNTNEDSLDYAWNGYKVIGNLGILSVISSFIIYSYFNISKSNINIK